MFWILQAIFIICLHPCASSTTIVEVPANIQAKIGDTTEINILFYPYDKLHNASITIVNIGNRLRPRLLTATTNFTNTTDLDTASVWKNRIEAEVVEGYGLSLKLLRVNFEDNGRYEVTIKTNSNQTHHFQLFIEAVAPPAFVSIDIPKPKGPVFKEFEAVNITCSGAAGRPLGSVYLSRLTKRSKVYQILDIPPVMHNYTVVNNGSYMIHYTFERVLRADDDQARYACEIHPGSDYFGSVYLTRSDLKLLKVDYVKPALLDIRPSTNIQAGAATLTLRCQPTTASGVTSVYRLDILRLTEGVSTEKVLGTIQVGKQPELGPGLTNPKYTVTGSLNSIDAVSTSSLQIVIQDPNCNDKGEYICKVTGGNSGGPLNKEQRNNVTVQDNPSNLVMNVVPSRLEYKLNDSISMTCNGNVGNPAKTWQWQTRRFPATTQWFRYTNEADIVTDPVKPPLGSSCSYRQQTVLTYRVKAQDDGLQIRCIVDNRDEFSKNFTLKVVGGTPDGNGGNSDKNTGDKASDAGMIAGIVIAVIVVIVIIIIVIVVVVRRKKTPGKDYDTGESGKGPVPREQNNDPKYDHRNNDYENRGVVNKSLDEPHETKPKPYGYQNNGGGRHNPGMDDSMSDDRSRVEYPAEDGTDIRGSNAMLGSAV